MMILSITPSSSATTSVSLEVKSTLFQLGALIFHLLFLFIGFSTQEESRSTRLASTLAQRTDYYCFVGVLSKLLRSRFRFSGRDPVYRSMFLVVLIKHATGNVR